MLPTLPRRSDAAALEELLAAHRLWSDWLREGRVRKIAFVAEKADVTPTYDTAASRPPELKGSDSRCRGSAPRVGPDRGLPGRARGDEQALIAAREWVVRVAPHRMGASRKGEREPGKSDESAWTAAHRGAMKCLRWFAGRGHRVDSGAQLNP